jgi:hypothetical protein
MGSKSEKQLNDLDSLLSLAATCDDAAVTLSSTSKALYNKISELRARNGGRGPGGSAVAGAMQKIAAKHFTGSCLHLRLAAHPAFPSFMSVVQSWLPALSRPEPIQPTTTRGD